MKRILLLVGLSIGLALFQSQGIFAKLQDSNALYAQDAGDVLDGTGRPPDRTHGGDRSPSTDGEVRCLTQLVVALVPGSPIEDCNAENAVTDSESYLAQTVTASPTIWLFIPDNETFRSAPSAQFVLLDEEEGLPLWVGFIEPSQITQNQAIIRIPVAYALEPGRRYRWSFTVTVDPDVFEQNPTVEGLIEYVVPTGDLAEKIEKIRTRSEQIDTIYTQNDIWHDALTLAGEQLSQAPENSALRATWSNLLASVGLSALADAPIINCCDVSTRE